MASAQDEELRRLHRSLREAETVDSIRVVLREIQGLEHAGVTTENFDNIREQAFETLVRLTSDRPGEAKTIILEELLPLCLRTKKQWKVQNIGRRYEKIARQWIDQFTGLDRETLREEVLAAILKSLNGPQVNPACATLLAIEYRNKEIVDALEALISSNDDETGDVAMRTRTDLGVPLADRPAVLSELHRRASLRWNYSLVASLREVADRESLDIVFPRLEPSDVAGKDKSLDWIRDSLGILIPAAVAERYPGDGDFQDQVWARFMMLGAEASVRSALLMNSQLAGGVDSPQVISTYLNLLEVNQGLHRDIIYYRLEDLVRPRQLLGWDSKPTRIALEILKNDACSGTGLETEWVTQEMRRKLLAWETLLSLDSQDMTSLLAPAVESETSGYVLNEVFEIAACLVISPLPLAVTELIAVKYDRIQDDDKQRHIAQIGAIRVAHSARSEDAFRALLDFGVFKPNSVLISLIDALADCAATLIANGHSDAENQLWQAAQISERSHLRIAASAALARLIRRELLRSPSASVLIKLLRDDSLEIFARRELLDAVGYIDPASLNQELVNVLRSIAGEGRPAEKSPENAGWPDLAPVALGSLARLGVLSTDPILLDNALGLTLNDGLLSFHAGTRDPSSSAFPLGIMYTGDPEKFGQAVAALIHAGDWVALSRLIPHLDQKATATPTVVIDALVQRIHRVQTDRSSVPELFSLLARLAPGRLIGESWGESSLWPPQVRSEFADSLAATKTSISTLLPLLEPLLSDGQYGVRRAAYRALASVDEEILAKLCEAWAVTLSGEYATEVRQRAAEAAGWINSQRRSTELEALATDPEPTVRHAFARCDRERRERVWASAYVDRILAVEDEQDIPSVWRYGRALGELGDDNSLSRLDQRRRSPDLAPALRHWLTRVIKKVRKRWDEVTRRWPEPWFSRQGRLEEVEGVVVFTNGREETFRGWLWQVVSKETTGISSWGGWSTHGNFSVGNATLRLRDRSSSEILVNLANSSSSFSSDTAYFSGNGKYPT